jgi:hypothetical protein
MDLNLHAVFVRCAIWGAQSGPIVGAVHPIWRELLQSPAAAGARAPCGQPWPSRGLQPQEGLCCLVAGCVILREMTPCCPSRKQGSAAEIGEVRHTCASTWPFFAVVMLCPCFMAPLGEAATHSQSVTHTQQHDGRVRIGKGELSSTNASYIRIGCICQLKRDVVFQGVTAHRVVAVLANNGSLTVSPRRGVWRGTCSAEYLFLLTDTVPVLPLVCGTGLAQ